MSSEEIQLTVQALGRRRSKLLAELADLETRLRPAMTAMREAGATWQEIISASGYTSIEGIKKAIDPDRRERSNGNARARRQVAAERTEVVQVARMLAGDDATEAFIAGARRR